LGIGTQSPIPNPQSPNLNLDFDLKEYNFIFIIFFIIKMQKVKFFYIFNKENIKKNCFWGSSLRRGVQYFLCTCYMYLIIFFILGILIQKQEKDKKFENIFLTTIKFLIYSLLDFISLNYFLKSTNSFSFKQAKLALNYLNLSIVWHIILFVMKTILFIMTYIKFSFLYFQTKTIEDHSEIYELIYIFVQICFYNILFSYTVQLSEGNDALVDGQEFNRYVENFAICDSISRRSIVSNPENRFSGNMNNNGSGNLQMQMANIGNNDNNNNFNRDYSSDDNGIIDDLN